MERIAIFPGSFDPITLGHQSVVNRALPMFDKIIVAIGQNSTKKGLFDIQKRVEMVKLAFANEPKILVETFSGLTVDFAKSKKAKYLLRGLRNTIDFEFERSIAQMNALMNTELETVFLITNPEFSAINATIVREILVNGGDISAFVPKEILDKLNF